MYGAHARSVDHDLEFGVAPQPQPLAEHEDAASRGPEPPQGQRHLNAPARRVTRPGPHSS